MKPAAFAIVPRKVLFIDQSGEMGGGEFSLLDIASSWSGASRVLLLEHGSFESALQERSVDVQVVELRAKTRRDGGLMSYFRAGPAVLRAAFAVTRHARAFDVVYANSQKAFIIGAVAARLAGKPCIWHLRDMLTAGHFSAAARGVAVWFANRFAHIVITNSVATAKAFIAAGGKSDKVRVVYNGFRPQAYVRDRAAESRSLRAQLGCGDAPLMGTFSRLAEWKGQHVILQAMASLPDTHLLLVGAPLFGEERYAQRLKSLVDELGIAGRVHFVGFKKDVASLMAAVDIVVHSSIEPEPFGRVIVEAMLAGTPVVAADAGGVKELIREGDNGLLVPPGDSPALAAAIKRLLHDRPETTHIAARACTDAQVRFALSGTVAQLQRLVHEVFEIAA